MSAAVEALPLARWRRPNATTTSCSASRATRARPSQEGVSQARARAAPGRLRGAGRRGALPRVAEAYEVLSKRRDARALRPLRARRAPRRRLRAERLRLRRTSADIFSAFFGDDLFGAAPRRPRARRRRRRRGRRSSSPRRSRGVDARRADVEVAAACERCGGDGAEPGTEPSPARPATAHGQVAAGLASVFGEFVRTQTCPRCAGAGRIVETPCDACDGAGRALERTEARGRDPGRDPRRPADPSRGEGTRARAEARPATPTCECASRRDQRFERDGDDSCRTVDLTIVAGRAGARSP